MITIRIQHWQIQTFIDAGINISGGTMLEDNSYVFILNNDDQEKFLQIVRQDIREHPELQSPALDAWVMAQESELKWKGVFSEIPDPYKYDGPTHIRVDREG